MSVDVYPTPADVTLGTMSAQNANAVAITDGRISLGGHSSTGVLDVQGSVVSEFANIYICERLWPVAPSGTVSTLCMRLEPPSGAASSTAAYTAIQILDPPTTTGGVIGVSSLIAAGTSRFNIHAGGSAQNYFAGNIGIANPTPTYPLDVTGNVRITGQIGVGMNPGSGTFAIRYPGGAGVHGFDLNPNADGGYAAFFRNAAGTGVGTIVTTATTTAYNTSSDVRLKHRIEKLVGALDVVQLLNPVKFKWNADDSPGEGFLAHELQQIIPAAVSGEPDALNDDGSIRPQQVDHSKLVPWLTAALQETIAQVEVLAARVIALEARLA